MTGKLVGYIIRCMLRLRLQRRGKRNHATYRVVVADQRAPIKGKFVADVGWYDPHTDEFKVDAEKVQEWINDGAKPTATVNNLLVDNKVIKGDKMTSWKPKKKEAEERKEKGTSNKKEETKEDNKKEASKEEKEEDKEKKEKVEEKKE